MTTTSAPPPPAGAPLPGPAPIAPPQPPRRRRRWVIPVVVTASVLVVLALVIALIVWIVGLASQRFPAFEGAGQEIVAGDPLDPVAVAPLECPTACFITSSIAATQASYASLAPLGVLNNTHPYGTFDPATAGEIHRSSAASWEANDGTPDACFFTLGNHPSTGVDASSTSEDPVHFTGTLQDTELMNTLDQSVRLFPDTASAAAYMVELSDDIEACTVLEIGPPSDRYRAEITPAAAFALPDSVAGAGWTRTGDAGPRWRAYVIDLQRGNLVVRSRLLTDGSITEPQFREFVEAYSQQLASLEPAT